MNLHTTDCRQRVHQAERWVFVDKLGNLWSPQLTNTCLTNASYEPTESGTRIKFETENPDSRVWVYRQKKPFDSEHHLWCFGHTGKTYIIQKWRKSSTFERNSERGMIHTEYGEYRPEAHHIQVFALRLDSWVHREKDSELGINPFHCANLA